MAIGTLLQFASWDTGGAEVAMIGPAANSAVVTSPAPAVPAKETYSLEMENTAGSLKNFWTFVEPVVDAGEWWTIGFTFRAGSLSDDSAFLLARTAQSGGVDWTLEVTSFTHLTLKDSAGGVVDAETGVVFTAATWHRVEIKYKKDNSSDVRVWVDGSLVISGTAKDLDLGGTELGLEFHNEVNPAFAIDILFGTAYIKFSSGAVGIDVDETQLGNWTSFGKDWTQHTTEFGTPLDAGSVWSDTDATPTQAAQAIYLPTGFLETNDGAYSRLGPNNDDGTLINGTPVGFAWVWRYETFGVDKSFPFNDRPIFRGRYGSSDDETADGTVATSYTVQELGERVLVIIEDSTGAHFPDNNHYAQIGFGAQRFGGVNGAVDFIDGWTLMLHQEPEVTGRVMSSMAGAGGLAGPGGSAGKGGGLAG